MNATQVIISGKTYDVEPIASDTFRLTFADKVYDVTEGERTTCNCPDWTYRHADLPYSEGCKHIRAIVAAGLVSNGHAVSV
jgi:hypothetical protein